MSSTRWTRGVFLLVGVTAAITFLSGDELARAVALCSWNLVVWCAVAWRAAHEDKDHPIRLMVVGFGIYTVAQVTAFMWPLVRGEPLPFPFPTDAALCAAYVLYVGVLLRVIRNRVAVENSVFDMLIVALGLSVPLWQFVVRPTVSVSAPLLTTVTTLMYPVMLTVLFTIALRLVFLIGFRGIPDLLILGWIAGELGLNVYFSVAIVAGSYDPASPWFLLLFGSWACIGLLALRPSNPPAVRPRGIHGRLVLLAIALAAPLLTLLLVGVDGLVFYAFAVAGGLVFAILVRLSTLTADLSEQRVLLAELESMSDDLEFRALHDALTGLPNRVLLGDRIDNALAQRVRGAQRGVALLLLDLDGFKTVNDTHGHDVGDQLLVAVASCLGVACRTGDTIGRLGGDEFAVLLPDADLAEALRVAERITTALLTPVEVGDLQLLVSASVGVVVAEAQDRSALVRQADIAMYAAKALGAGGTAVFDPQMHAGIVARHALEIELRGAAGRGELLLEYQPVLHLPSHTMVGVEALVRWQHPLHGRIPPLDFIGLAEESGSIRQIGDWVLLEACEQALRWDAEHVGSRPLDIAVNLSPRQLLDVDLVRRVAGILTMVGIEPGRVTLEVTESALGGDTERMIDKLEQLKTLGVRLAIDDFGTGYSSLSFLRRLPVDILKIDKSFVDGIAREPEEWALTTAIVKLATSLGKQTLAEGIELGEQLAHLRALNCELGQGYLFDRPLPAATVGERIAAAARDLREPR